MFKNQAEIDKVYRDHIDSLEMWGGPADLDGVYEEWSEATQNFIEGYTHTFSLLP